MTGTSLAEIDPDRWSMIQRMARAFAESDLVPEHMKGNVANCTVALLMANQMNENPVMTLQNIFFVHGRAGWITQYVIARANNSGKFRGPLRWRSEGSGDDLAVTCWAKLRDIEDDAASIVEAKLDMRTAIDSGWTSYVDRKTGKKETHGRWATPAMCEQMLRWRSAAWLVRLYAPEVMFGLPTADEITDTAEMKDVTPPKLGIDDFKPGGIRTGAPVIEYEPEAAPQEAGGPDTAAERGARGGAGKSPAAPAAEDCDEAILREQRRARSRLWSSAAPAAEDRDTSRPATNIVTDLDRRLTEAAQQGRRSLDQAWLLLSEQERDLARGRRQHYYDIAAKEQSQ